MGFITAAWVFGAVWQTTTTGTPLTLYAQGLKATPIQFGILTAIPFLASLASVLGSLTIERTGRRKALFFPSLYLQRLMWIPLALIPLWMVGHSGPAGIRSALYVFLGLLLLTHMAGAVGGPAWVSWMGDIVPARVNGKYFSRRRQWGTLAAIPAAAFVGWFLDVQLRRGNRASGLNWCAVLFMSAAVFGLADIVMFQFVPEPKKKPAGGGILRAFERPLRDKPFLRFAGFVGVLQFSVSCMGQFQTLYLLKVVKVDNLASQMMIVVGPMLAQLVVLPVWGAAADRIGKRPLLILAAGGLVPVSLGWCFLSSTNPWLAYVLCGLGAALFTGVEVANFTCVIESTSARGQAGGSGYFAVNSVIINVAGCVGGLAAGFAAQLLQNWHWQPIAGIRPAGFYDVLFVASSMLRLAALVGLIALTSEAGSRPTVHAIRFVASGVFGQITSVPLAMFRFLNVSRPTQQQQDPTLAEALESLRSSPRSEQRA